MLFEPTHALFEFADHDNVLYTNKHLQGQFLNRVFFCRWAAIQPGKGNRVFFCGWARGLQWARNLAPRRSLNLRYRKNIFNYDFKKNIVCLNQC